MLRQLIPRPLKLRRKLAQRARADLKNGLTPTFAQISHGLTFPHSMSIEQPILNATTEQSRVNKIHNIKLAARSIEQIELKSGEVFSFWRAVGCPAKKQGFRKGINIIEGKVVEDYGGGLCQLSSIIYHTALIAGLTVVERSNHSVDLYQHQERYTPLGSDSAVFYGYKDLRLRNDHPCPIRFRFEVLDKTITCFITSLEKMTRHLIEFEIDHEDKDYVRVMTKQGNDIVAHSNYKKETTSS